MCADACWALSFLADGLNAEIHVVIHSGVIPFLVPLLEHQEVKIVIPALRTLGNISTGSGEQTQVIIDNGILPKLQTLLGHLKQDIVRDAVWTLSNITAGSREQIQAVIDAGLISQLIEVLSDGEFKTQVEAAWAVSNFTVWGAPDQIKYLVGQRAIPPMCSLLKAKDAKLIQVVLEGLRNILRHSGDKRLNLNVVNSIEESGGLDLIDSLQEHNSSVIEQLAKTIIDQYFPSDDEIGAEGGDN